MRAQAVRVRQETQLWSFVMARASALMPVRLVIPIMSRAMAVAPAAASAQVDLLLSSTEISPISRSVIAIRCTSLDFAPDVDRGAELVRVSERFRSLFGTLEPYR